MIQFLTVLCIISAIVVLVKTAETVASIDINRYQGHPIRFAALSLHWGLVAAGSIAVALGLENGGVLLLIAIALLKLFDRCTK